MIEGDLPGNVYLWAIWHWLLYAATWKPTKVLWNGKQREIQPGTVVFGLKELAEKFDCSRDTIHRWLRYLCDTGRITYETSNRGCIVSVCNWELYQGKEEFDADDVGRQPDTDLTPTGRQPALSEEVQEEKKEYIEHRKQCSKPNFDLETLYQGYPRKKGKTPGLRKLEKEIKTEADYLALKEAIRNYGAEVANREPEHILYFSTFAGQWKDWVNVEPDNTQSTINTTPIILEAS
jgi:hypothetical protein